MNSNNGSCNSYNHLRNAKIGEYLIIKTIDEMRREFGSRWENIIEYNWNLGMNILCGGKNINN